MIFNLSTIETRKTRAAKALEQVIGSHDVVLFSQVNRLPALVDTIKHMIFSLIQTTTG
jgi:hypothetical protein